MFHRCLSLTAPASFGLNWPIFYFTVHPYLCSCFFFFFLNEWQSHHSWLGSFPASVSLASFQTDLVASQQSKGIISLSQTCMLSWQAINWRNIVLSEWKLGGIMKQWLRNTPHTSHLSITPWLLESITYEYVLHCSPVMSFKHWLIENK